MGWMIACFKMALKILLISGLIFLALPAIEAFAEDIDIGYDIFIFDNRLTVDFDFSSLFSEQRISSIKAGYPLYIRFRVQLKRHLSLWFDPELRKHECLLKAEYQGFGSRFHLDFFGFNGQVRKESFRGASGLLDRLNDLMILQSAKIDALDPDDNLYFCFNLELRSITTKEISQARNWYRGKQSGGDSAGEEDKGLPKQLFEQLLNLAGLGPTKYQLASYIFRITQLKTVRP